MGMPPHILGPFDFDVTLTLVIITIIYAMFQIHTPIYCIYIYTPVYISIYIYIQYTIYCIFFCTSAIYVSMKHPHHRILRHPSARPKEYSTDPNDQRVQDVLTVRSDRISRYKGEVIRSVVPHS